MPSGIPPVEGNWYETPEGETFFVVTLDEDDDIIEIQYFDGTVEELDLESWDELDVEPIPQPDDWIGPYDDEEDDYEYGSRDMDTDEWGEPLEE